MDIKVDAVKRLEARRVAVDKFLEGERLVSDYKENTPVVDPLWDTGDGFLCYNDLDDEMVSSGLTLFVAPFEDVWGGLYDPSVYEGNTLWENSHDSKKIARVISHWLHNKSLSPMFLLKHSSKNAWLVADGKHRLTVAHYMNFKGDTPFLVKTEDENLVVLAIPAAVKVGKA
ncbi:hypothetical protein [Pseudomonas sp. QC2]|uniref:hypothetical protein n=1 Tax=Pseudomonas sp. QC2 TaxID=2065822 RepID=UPI0011AF9D04|nr:hypothetical protein [Pseudomonas sp. QC2]